VLIGSCAAAVTPADFDLHKLRRGRSYGGLFSFFVCEHAATDSLVFWSGKEPLCPSSFPKPDEERELRGFGFCLIR
jgi:hypothetical protein